MDKGVIMKKIEKLNCIIISSDEVITKEEENIRLAKYVCMLIDWKLNPPEKLKGKNLKEDFSNDK